MKKQHIYGILLLLFSTTVLAHPGHSLPNAYAGFAHPFMGWDHLLMMLAVGVWAAKSTGRIRWQLPLTFIAFMALGACLGFSGLNVPGLETAIASSVIAMGVLLLTTFSMSKKASISIAAIFALLHGMAHGLAFYGLQNNSALLGMLAATAMLHSAGYFVSLQQHQVKHWLSKGLAFLMMLIGSFLLVF